MSVRPRLSPLAKAAPAVSMRRRPLSAAVAVGSRPTLAAGAARASLLRFGGPFRVRRSAFTSRPTFNSSGGVGGGGPRSVRDVWNELCSRPIQYATIPAVAAFLGLYTNWMGVKMLFYPIEYVGTEWYRQPFVPYGFLGWQGVVPCKTEKMANRLVHIVTDRLLTMEEAFGRMDPARLAELLQPMVEEEVRKEPYGDWVVMALRPILPLLLTRVVANLQKEIESILDLRSVVLEAFVRDKAVLVDLFQKVGRVELDFLVESGLGFGFILGIGQMLAWVIKPKLWTLPASQSFLLCHD
ncbi:hypothetical protein ACHAWF_006496 [Thalassiosira exigua]